MGLVRHRTMTPSVLSLLSLASSPSSTPTEGGLCFPAVGKHGRSSRSSCSWLCVMTIMGSQDWKSNSSQRNQEPFCSFNPTFLQLCLPFTQDLTPPQTPQQLKTPLEQFGMQMFSAVCWIVKSSLVILSKAGCAEQQIKANKYKLMP